MENCDVNTENLIKDMMVEGNMSKCVSPAHTPITMPINKEERPEDNSDKAKKVLNDIYPYMRVVGQTIGLKQTRPMGKGVVKPRIAALHSSEEGSTILSGNQEHGNHLWEVQVLERRAVCYMRR